MRRLIAPAAAALVAGCVSIAEHARPERLPIVDFHAHVNGDIPAEQLVELMDRTGVRTMVLMARYYANPRDGGYGSDAQAADYARRHPGRFVPFVAGQRGELSRPAPGAWDDPGAFAWYLREAEEKLRTGQFLGLGEYILHHHAYDLAGWGQRGGEVRLRADGPLMHAIAAAGARYGVPVVLHLEAEPEQTAEAVRLFEANPDTTFVWAHNCGRAGAEQIRDLLQRFPRVMCDLGGMMVVPGSSGGYGRRWPRDTPHIHLVQDESGEVYPEMLRLFEELSDRFLVGTDAAHTPALRTYEARIRAFRRMLSQMTPATAARIAHENADRLLAARRAR